MNLKTSISIFVSYFIVFQAHAVTAEKTFVHRKVWKDKLEKNIPTKFCESKSFFRNCYSVNEKECTKLAETHMKKCFMRINLPEKISTYDKGVSFATKIGMCIGDKMSFSLDDRKTNKQGCSIHEWR